MNKEKRMQLTNTLRDNKIKVWFFEEDKFGMKSENRTFLGFGDLSDKELANLFSSSCNFGHLKEGFLWIKEDRNIMLNWKSFK